MQSDQHGLVSASAGARGERNGPRAMAPPPEQQTRDRSNLWLSTNRWETTRARARHPAEDHAGRDDSLDQAQQDERRVHGR